MARSRPCFGAGLHSLRGGMWPAFARHVILDKVAEREHDGAMRYSVLVEAVEESEEMPGMYYAHVPSLGLTTHGRGVDGALAAARDLVQIWIDEKRACGEPVAPVRESLLAAVEVD